MEIVLDSHVLFWHYARQQNLRNKVSVRARAAIERAEVLYVPTITLLEVHYIFRKYGNQRNFKRFLYRVSNDKRVTVVPLDMAVVEKVIKRAEGEMHDSIIIATAQVLEASLISRDEAIARTYRKTVW